MGSAEKSLRKPNSEGGGVLKRFARAVIALVVAVATLFSGTITAQAVQSDGMPGYWFNPASDGSGWWVDVHGSGLGPVRYEGDRPVYCIEAGVPVDFAGTWENASDQNSKIAAFMVNQHKGDRGDMTQAAVAYAIHDHLDRGNSHFRQLVAVGLEGADIGAVGALAAQFWRDARANMPDRIQASYQYTQGKRKGTVNPGILNADGQFVAGIPYTITLDGPAVFDATGNNSYSGVTSGQEEHISWTATGNGGVTAHATYTQVTGKKLNSPGQDLFGLNDPSNVSGNIQFEVINNFQPTVTTEVSSKKLPAGEPVKDRVTSGVARGDTWVDGTTVKAKGYYFTGAPKTILQTIKQTGTTSNPEKPADYLKRVEEKLGKPVATAETKFTAANQTHEVTAKNVDGTDYVNPEDGMFGGWLWVIVKSEQSEDDQQYIKNSYIHEFGQVPETTVQPARTAHDSVVLEQYTGMNQDIMDTITIGGFPEDYGAFDGSQDYGFGADAKAKIRVWWAGSGTGDKKEDLKYKPATEEEPAKDEHHKLVGEWEVPAGNGTYKVGGGKITFRPENAGKAQTVAEGVDISATDASQTGYYVFIYDFPGSDRAVAFKSAYNDPWERSFVEINPSTVDLTSNVSAVEVGQGVEFHDVAHINGQVSRGSYVLFTAYDAVSGTPDTGAPKLLDAMRVNITNEQADNSATKAFDVVSPKTKTDKTGNVYWQAELYNAAGEPLASHQLGIESETTIVRGVSVTTKVSSEQVYVNQKFHDTAIIDGKVGRGSYVIFDAYGPCDDEYTDGAPKLLDSAKVAIPDNVADKSAWNTSFTVDSPDIASKTAGNVYWQAKVYRADGLLLAQHDLGIAGETVKVAQPSITTQVTKTTVHPGEEFADKATIDGKVERGSYVTFDAYEPVSGDPDTTAGKLLDSARVDITDEQADRSDKEKITVTSPKTKTDDSGSVYWKATLHAKDGTAIATHDLGLPSETVYVAPGGYLSSQAQVMGAAGTPLYDTITVYDEDDSHEGNGNGNPSGLVGSVPKGSYVTVEAYRQDGHNTASKDNLLGSEDFPVDVDAMQDGQITFKAQSDKFVMDKAGLVYWVATLKTANGAVLDKAVFGESGDQHGTGVESQERTVVQKFETTIGKKTVSVNMDEYAEQTVNLYDKVKQTFYEFAEGDVDVLIGQTPKNAKIQFEVWEQSDGDDASKDKLVWTGAQNELPSIELPYRQHDGGAVWQNFKSENFTVGKDWNPGKHYVRFRVTCGDEEVYYAPARDKAESFNVVKVTSTATEPIVTTDMAHIEEVLHVEGTLEKGSSYQVELWKTNEQGETTEKVDETDVVTLDKAVTNGDIKVTMDNPGTVGGFQFRFKVWSADNLGGDPTGIDAGSVLLPDDWKQGDGYERKALIYEGANVKSEHFEVIRISTDVTGTTNMHTVKGEHYVDVTNGADINDHATIEGNLDRDGYRVRFELYEKLDGAPEDDRFVLNTPDVGLEAGTKELDSALAKLDQPGDYYWVTVFSKADNSTFAPDGQAVIRSDRRIEEESFHAVRITTTTYKWSSAGGKLQDVAHIEGTLPGDSTVGFELHDYASGDKVADAEDSVLSDMDGYEEGSTDMTVTSPAVTVPTAGDHYFVEWVKIPGDDQGEDKEFHRGNDRVDNESTRTIDVNTTTFTEIHLGDTISDQTFLDNISYETDIREDYTDKELSASWEVWKQGDGDVDTDTMLTTLGAPAEEGAGEAEPSDAGKPEGEDTDADKTEDVTPLPLENGQTMAESAKWTPAQTGIYYFRVRVTADDGTLVAYGDAREPSETLRVIDSLSNTTQVVEEGKPVKDKVTISGPVLEGTMVSWRVFRQAGTPDADEMVADWSTPTTGAYIITAEDAAKALKDGKVTIESPLAYEDGKAGDTVYFQYSLTAPKRGEDGNPAKPAKDDNGEWTMDHLTTVDILPIDMDKDGDGVVDGDNAEAQVLPASFHADLARVESETVRFVKVTTTANTHEATVGDKIHDTAHITGTVPDGTYCVKFEYWEQAEGDDSSKDKLVTTTDCVAVKPGENPDVDSPEITADKDGTFYWREHLIRHEGEDDEYEVSYGKPRVPDETVKVKAKPLAMTGIAVGGAMGAMLLAGLAGSSLALLSGRRRRTLGRHSRAFGRHAA